jgi:hypothetical protein
VRVLEAAFLVSSQPDVPLWACSLLSLVCITAEYVRRASGLAGAVWKQRRLWNAQAAIRTPLGLLLPAAPQR